MNIFYLDEDAAKAAIYMVDKHVVKMIVETAQLLSTAHRILDGNETIEQKTNGRKVKRWQLYDNREPHIYKATHVSHPSAKWARESIENYWWLSDHFIALIAEYKFRYKKLHACIDLIEFLQPPPFNLKMFDKTEVPCAMPDEYKISSSPIINYRNYYKNAKSHLHKWTNRQPPEWINE